jgi:hypothetical protein
MIREIVTIAFWVTIGIGMFALLAPYAAMAHPDITAGLIGVIAFATFWVCMRKHHWH